jgi:hypothetical protein
MTKNDDFDLRLMKAAACSGFVMIVGVIIGQGLLMHFIPAPSPVAFCVGYCT